MSPLLVLVASLSFVSGDSGKATVSTRPTAASAALAPGSADSIVVEKSARKLTLYMRGVPVRTYLVALGTNPVGPKKYKGDNRTPEGLYRIEGRNPGSKYHLALRVSYPNDVDRRVAASLGKTPGGDIMIHGLPRGYEKVGADHRLDDWTKGCIALTNQEIEEIYSAVRLGAAIEIRP